MASASISSLSVSIIWMIGRSASWFLSSCSMLQVLFMLLESTAVRFAYLSISILKIPDPVCRGDRVRSEEHTSELQSRENLVCRLLLEKENHFRKSAGE